MVDHIDALHGHGQRGSIADIGDLQCCAVAGNWLSAVKVVKDRHLIRTDSKGGNQMTADESGATRNENFHEP